MKKEQVIDLKHTAMSSNINVDELKKKIIELCNEIRINEKEIGKVMYMEQLGTYYQVKVLGHGIYGKFSNEMTYCCSVIEESGHKKPIFLYSINLYTIEEYKLILEEEKKKKENSNNILLIEKAINQSRMSIKKSMELIKESKKNFNSTLIDVLTIKKVKSCMRQYLHLQEINLRSLEDLKRTVEKNNL